jgi:hypothetical protein
MSEFKSEPVGEVTVSEASTVKVSRFDGKDGKKRVDIRLFVSGEKYTGATKKGVTLPVDKVGELIQLLQKAQAAP